MMMITCKRCCENKPPSAFHRNSKNRNGYDSKCKLCWYAIGAEKRSKAGSEKMCPECWMVRPVEDFAKNDRTFDGYWTKCRFCYGKTNNPRSRELRTGWTDDEYKQALIEQEGLCAICKKAQVTALHADHDHKSKQKRALLCNNCNTGIGKFFDDVELLQSAISYLNQYSQE